MGLYHVLLWQPLQQHRMVQSPQREQPKRSYCWPPYRVDTVANECFSAYFVVSSFQIKLFIFCIKDVIARGT